MRKRVRPVFYGFRGAGAPPEDALREETGIPEGWRLAREDEPETADEPAQDDENRAAEPPETNDPVNHAETAQREEGRKGGEEGKG